MEPLEFDLHKDPPSLERLVEIRCEVDEDEVRTWRSVGLWDWAQTPPWTRRFTGAGIVVAIVGGMILSSWKLALPMVAWGALAVLLVAMVFLLGYTMYSVAKRRWAEENQAQREAVESLSPEKHPDEAQQWERWTKEYARIHGYNSALQGAGRPPVMGEWRAAERWIREKRKQGGTAPRRKPARQPMHSIGHGTTGS